MLRNTWGRRTYVSALTDAGGGGEEDQGGGGVGGLAPAGVRVGPRNDTPVGSGGQQREGMQRQFMVNRA